MLIKSDWPKVRPPTAKVKWWTVDPRPVQSREYFETATAAKNRSKEIRGAIDRKQLQENEQIESMAAVGKLKTHGVSVYEAADFWIKHNAIQPKRVSEAREEWLRVKLGKVHLPRPELTMKHWNGLKSCTKHLVRFFGHREIHSISKEEWSVWVDSLPGGKLNRNNIRAGAMNLINFSVERGYVKENQLRFKKPEKVRGKDRAPVSILTIKEVKELLDAAQGTDCMVYLLLGLFAGLRPEEAEVVHWEWFENGSLQVREGKTGPRWVHLNPKLWSILMKLKGDDTGCIVPTNFRVKLDEIAANAGYVATKTLLNYYCPEKLWNDHTSKWKKNTKPWPQDVLRHSHASYWLPIHHSRKELARLMGNSERVIDESYDRRIPIYDAEKFWRFVEVSLFQPLQNNRIFDAKRNCQMA
jgi:hypothetical protein